MPLKRRSERAQPRAGTVPAGAATVVLHAGVVVRATVAPPDNTLLEILLGWRKDGVRLVAPDLWLSEAVTTVRRIVSARILSRAEGKTAIANLLWLGLETVALDLALCRQAFDWAERLGQTRAHDAFYVALAERERGWLWTADRRLASRSRQSGAAWVHYIGELGPRPTVGRGERLPP